MKTTRVVFRPGSKRVTSENSMAQWDYGQLLAIEGLALPEVFEVDFSIDPTDGTSEPAVGANNTVQVPDSLLELGETIYAFIFLHEENDDGETRYRIAIPIEKRPERGTVEPDPVEQSVITQTIAALNDAAERAYDAAGTAEAARDAILNLDVDAETIEPDAVATVDKIVDDETGDISLHFRIPQGPQGERGNKGDTGARFTPDVSGAGVLSWTNNGNLDNPEPFDLVAAVLDALPAAEEARF